MHRHFNLVRNVPVGPQFVKQTARFSSAGSVTSAAIPLPSPLVVGHLLIVFAAGDNSFTWSAPAGWGTINNNSATDFVAFWRIVDGTEGTSVTLTLGGAEKFDAFVAEFSNTNQVSPIGLKNTQTGGSPFTSSGLTTGTNGSLAFALCTSAAGLTLTSFAGAGWTSEGILGLGNYYDFGTAAKYMAASGATGGITEQNTSSGTARISIYEIKA